jgi:LPS export ABC transporter protein LptC
VVALTALGCGPAAEPFDAAPPAPPELPPVQLEKVVFEGFHGDLRDLSVTAESASVDMIDHRAELHSVAIGVSGDEAGKLEIAAPVGVFRLDRDDFALTGGVQGTTPDGARFKTDSVQYVAKKRALESSSSVELRRANIVLHASGMEIALDTHRLRLTGSVQANVKPE